MIKLIAIVLISVFLLFLVYPAIINNLFGYFKINFFKFPKIPFSLGLDLIGGINLIYEADLSQIKKLEEREAMSGVRDIIERRINIFGVKEPIVQISGKNRLIVELPGLKNISEAVKLIGETPFLEFRELSGDNEQEANFVSTGLTGKDLRRAYLSFEPNTFLPQVGLEFNERGSKLLTEITKKNIGKPLAIFLDGQPISIPNVKDVIENGQAVISGQFSIEQARQLAQRLNAGALPVPIKLISQQTIGPKLGLESLQKIVKSGIYGAIALSLFMIFYYRLLGLVAVLALFIYTLIVLTIFKLIPVTLTLSGIAGFVLSLGMAIDGNILIFSRIREEIKQNQNIIASLDKSFNRAWLSIRDSQFTTLISALILYVFTTSLVKGFALTLIIGAIISIFTSVVITKIILKSIITKNFKTKWLL